MTERAARTRELPTTGAAEGGEVRYDGMAAGGEGGAVGDEIAVGLARAAAWRYLQAAVQPPGDDRFRVLVEGPFRDVVLGAAGWMRADPAFRPQRLGPGEADPARIDPPSLLPRPGDGSIRADHRDLFGHSVSKDCPPYGGEYHPNTDITFRSQRLADVAGFYRAFGLDRAADARERHDHLAFEAAFMETVIARELYAIREGLGEERVEVCRRAQRDFFVDHLGWWLPAFGLRLSSLRPRGFYGALGRWIRALVAVERAVLDVPPFDELPVAKVDDYDPRDDACGACAVGLAGAVRAPASRE